MKIVKIPSAKWFSIDLIRTDFFFMRYLYTTTTLSAMMFFFMPVTSRSLTLVNLRKMSFLLPSYNINCAQSQQNKI